MLGFSWQPFSEIEEEKIVAAIKEAETKTSGEIRVHIDKWCKTDPIYKAQNKFYHLEMDKTKLRNAVLIYLAFHEKKFAIVGDEGINQKVPSDFWLETKDLMSSHFKNGQIVEGLCEGILLAGHQLAEHFPIGDNDKNELSDGISYA